MSQNNNQTAGAILIKQEPGINLNNIKAEQPSGGRLISFKLPRDLTLGGRLPTTRAGANKKIFTPNLNAVRNKNADVRTSKDTSQRGRGRSDRGRSERSNRGRGGSSLVQTSGLFSEGAAGGNKTRSSSGSNYGSSASDSAVAQMRRPTLVKREFKIDPEEEERQIQEILGDDSDEFDEETIKASTMPVMLTDPKKSSIEKIKTEIKKEVKVKLEKTVDMEVTEIEECEELTKPSEGNNCFSELTIKQETAPNLDNYPESLEEFLTRSEPQMFLLQLPDTLPGRAPDPEPAESAEFERTATPDPSANFCTLDHLEEGQIGKIVRYKSGKTKLILGEHSFDINLGMNPGFLQEVMSISTNTKERSGEAINLGRIQAKLSATPDWEFLSSKKNS